MKDARAISLLQLASGTGARVVEVPRGGQQVRFASLGLVAGASIELLQADPVVVVRIGATTLAIERELAAQVQVQRGNGALQGVR